MFFSSYVYADDYKLHKVNFSIAGGDLLTDDVELIFHYDDDTCTSILLEKESNYKIDFDMFNTLEIVKIIEFFKLIESTKTKKVSPNVLVNRYREYQSIINNKSLEKKYDKMLFEKSNISIYHTVKPYLK